MKVISIIPARGESKGIPKKNIALLNNKPLIAYTIEDSLDSKFIDRTFVSTEDNEIAEVSSRYGAEVIKRPEWLAHDHIQTEPVLIHVLDYLEKNESYIPDYIVLLQCTSPLRDKDDIDKAIEILIQENADSLFSCTKLEAFFIWGTKGNQYQSINHDYKHRKRRQDIEPQYLENGSIYVFKNEIIRKEKNRLGGKIAIFKMEFWKSFQIDNYDDLDICNYYIKNKLKDNGVVEHEG